MKKLIIAMISMSNEIKHSPHADKDSAQLFKLWTYINNMPDD